MKLSNCCQAPIIKGDFCSACKEHCVEEDNLIDSFIRDITKVTPMSKSEARRRLDEILKYNGNKDWNKEFNEKFGHKFNIGVVPDDITKKEIIDFIEALLEDTIRPNDISSWIEYGIKRGYIDYYEAKIKKDIRDVLKNNK